MGSCGVQHTKHMFFLAKAIGSCGPYDGVRWCTSHKTYVFPCKSGRVLWILRWGPATHSPQSMCFLPKSGRALRILQKESCGLQRAEAYGSPTSSGRVKDPAVGSCDAQHTKHVASLARVIRSCGPYDGVLWYTAHKTYGFPCRSDRVLWTLQWGQMLFRAKDAKP